MSAVVTVFSRCENPALVLTPTTRVERMESRGNRTVDSIREHLEDALSTPDSDRQREHIRESLQLLERLTVEEEIEESAEQ